MTTNCWFVPFLSAFLLQSDFFFYPVSVCISLQGWHHHTVVGGDFSPFNCVKFLISDASINCPSFSSLSSSSEVVVASGKEPWLSHRLGLFCLVMCPTSRTPSSLGIVTAIIVATRSMELNFLQRHHPLSHQLVLFACCGFFWPATARPSCFETNAGSSMPILLNWWTTHCNPMISMGRMAAYGIQNPRMQMPHMVSTTTKN